MRHASLLLCLLPGLVACNRTTPAPDGAPAAPQVAAALETEPTVEDGANAVSVWVDPKDPQRSLVLGAGGTGGLEVYGLDGKRRQRLSDAGAVIQVDVRPAFSLGDRDIPLVTVFAADRAALAFYAIGDDGTLAPLASRTIEIGDEATGLCSFRSPITGKNYALVITDGGMLQQWELYAGRGTIHGVRVRDVALGAGAGQCVVDDASGVAYYSDESLGVFALDADPEADTVRRPIDLVKPFGGIEAEPKGVALYRSADGDPVLVVADIGANRFLAYSTEGKQLGQFAIGAGNGVDALDETEGVALAGAPLGSAFPNGVFVATDESNDNGASNFKVVSWADAARVAGLKLMAAADPGAAPAAPARAVKPVLETPPAVSYGDAADDPAIWVHPQDASRSAVIATDKRYGLYVYDLSGRLLQSLPAGRMNNVDLRDGFPFGDGAATLVTASDRTRKAIAIYRFDARTRQLEDRAAGVIPTGFGDPYGLCMYRSARSGDYFVFINDSEDGRFRQWRLTPDGARVRAEQVREFVVGTQAEGCVADDETGRLYIAEEDVGLWRYSAEPDGGEERTAIDKVGQHGLVDDLEGVALWRGEGGRGYLVVSNQGANNYAVFRREEPNEFVGLFHVVASELRGIDGASETDGLDVSSAALGPQFPQGLLVVQDGRNIAPAERQNYKYVSWADVAAALELK